MMRVEYPRELFLGHYKLWIPFCRIFSSGFVSAVLGQMTYSVASGHLTVNGPMCCSGASFTTKGRFTSISIGGSIILKARHVHSTRTRHHQFKIPVANVTMSSIAPLATVKTLTIYHAIHDKNIVTLEENLKENISSRTLLVFKEPSFLLPPPEPPDEYLNFEPNLVMKNVVLNEDFSQNKNTLPLNVEDVDSFTFITYTEESSLIFSFKSENFVFDPGIVTFHKPVAF
ncbi:hypothetical protein Tco_0252247 [Tanacetum coccineum]